MPVSHDHVCRCVQASLLNCLCAAIPARERVIACEDVFELPKGVVRHARGGGSGAASGPLDRNATGSVYYEGRSVSAEARPWLPPRVWPGNGRVMWSRQSGKRTVVRALGGVSVAITGVVAASTTATGGGPGTPRQPPMDRQPTPCSAVSRSVPASDE